jgi:hypothetical protein
MARAGETASLEAREIQQVWSILVRVEEGCVHFRSKQYTPKKVQERPTNAEKQV